MARPWVVARGRRPSAIDEVLPQGVVWREAFGGDEAVLASGDGQPFSSETAALSRRSPPQRRASAAVRVCARRGLTALGAPTGPIIPGPYGEPIWPPGVVGSMTHCFGYRAAAVGWASAWIGVGIDAEPDQPLPPGLIDAVAQPAEVEEVGRLAARHRGEPSWDRLLFCAKEAAFKALYAEVGRVMEFDELRIEFDSWSRGVRAVFVDEEHGTSTPAGEGAWLVENRTLIVVLTRPRP